MVNKSVREADFYTQVWDSPHISTCGRRSGIPAVYEEAAKRIKTGRRKKIRENHFILIIREL